VFKISVLSVFLAGHVMAVEPVTDEAQRMKVLSDAFPGMQISGMPGKTIDSTWKPKNLTKNALTFPDAMANEKIYRVTGKAADETERCAAEGAGNARQVRLQLYQWPATGWLAILQYAFVGVSVNAQCNSVPLLLHLTQDWKVKQRLVLDSHGHTSFQGIRLMDLTGDGREELAIESDSGQDEALGSDLHIYELTQAGFEERLDMASRMSASVMDQEQYMQVLDIPRTLKAQGKQFCFVKTIYAEEGKWFPTPRVSNVCYPRGRGVEPARK